jgi:hypothetical protein
VTERRDGSSSPIDERVARWCAADHENAFVKSDHDVIESTVAVRTLIQRLLAEPGRLLPSKLDGQADRDLLNAFGVLGRLVAERGGSPTLAAATVDGALNTLAPTPSTMPGWALPARAALAEAFALAQLEAGRAEGAARWEYPRCAVGLADGTVAIAAGFPDDDLDALGAWASRVAHDAALAGVRRVVVSGSEAAEAALDSAFELAGIARVPGRSPPTRRLPLRKP